MLPALEAQRLSEAFRMLQNGRASHALTVASQVAANRPESAEALHLMALCAKALGDYGSAATSFLAALTRTPDDPDLLGNYANLLCRLNRFPEAIMLYRKLLSIAPGHSDGWMNLGLAQIETGSPREACESLERSLSLRPTHAATWQAMGAARRADGDLDGAEKALRESLRLNPQNGAAWTSLGVIRRLQGDPTDSLTCYSEARRSGFTGPQIDDAEASAHLDLGEPDQALDRVRKLIKTFPAYATGYSLLAHILWEHGAVLAPGEDPSAAFRTALVVQSSNIELRNEFIKFLLDSKSPSEALVQIHELRSLADSPSLLAMEANALDVLGEHNAASALFRDAYPVLKNNAEFLNLYVRHLLQSGQPDAAAARALEALEIDPHNQVSLAFLGVAWRLIADPREKWLCDYDQLIAEIPIESEADCADQESFLLTLRETLMQLHSARREPVDQSVRGGSQTSGVLFGRRDQVIISLRRMLAKAVSCYIAQLPDDASHPFLRRKSGGFRFAGSWSVKLLSSGRHVNHFHQQGWISSAFYVSLPPSIASARMGETAGHIQFGAPPVELGLRLGPRRIIQPRAGQLVLFPSYFWHGTLPFDDKEPRITVAFDAVPT